MLGVWEGVHVAEEVGAELGGGDHLQPEVQQGQEAEEQGGSGLRLIFRVV